MITVKMTTRTRTHNTVDVFAMFAGDDPVLLGTLERSFGSFAWRSPEHRFHARSKWEAVLETARLAGPKYFDGRVRYTYGAHTLDQYPVPVSVPVID